MIKPKWNERNVIVICSDYRTECLALEKLTWEMEMTESDSKVLNSHINIKEGNCTIVLSLTSSISSPETNANESVKISNIPHMKCQNLCLN